MTITELKAAYWLAMSLDETNLALGELSDAQCDVGAFLSHGHVHNTRSLNITKDEIVGLLSARRASLLDHLAAMDVYPDPLPAKIEPAPAAEPIEYRPICAPALEPAHLAVPPDDEIIF